MPDAVLKCLDHNETVDLDVGVGGVLKDLRDYIAKRQIWVDLDKTMREVAGVPATEVMSGWSYTTIDFLITHPLCEISITDEHGGTYSLDPDKDKTPETWKIQIETLKRAINAINYGIEQVDYTYLTRLERLLARGVDPHRPLSVNQLMELADVAPRDLPLTRKLIPQLSELTGVSENNLEQWLANAEAMKYLGWFVLTSEGWKLHSRTIKLAH